MISQETKHWRGWAGAIGGVVFGGGLAFNTILGDLSVSPLGALLDGLYAGALVLVLVGLWGVWTRVGGPARLGLAVAVLGGGAAVVGLLGLALDTLRRTETPGAWGAFILGLLGFFLGTSIVMLIGLMTGMLPRLGAGLVLAGAVGAILSGVVSSAGYDQFTALMQQIVGGALVVALLVFAAGWVALGLALRAGRLPGPQPGMA